MTRLQTFETAALPAPDRVASWLDALATMCGPLYADPLGATTLDARLAFGEVGRLRVGHIAASRHRIGLTEALAREAPHPVAKMIVQTVGTSVYEQRGERLALWPGECLVYDVSRPHMITSGAHSEHLVVVIPHELVASRGLRLDSLHAQRYSAGSGVGRLCASLVESTLDQMEAIDPACEADLATAILNLVLSPLAQATEPQSALRARIKRYIREHAREPDLSIDHIAQALRCSKRTLHLAFEGCERTVADYLRATRLDGCKAELERHPERAVAEVAYAWGFASAAHFSRLFHQRFGHAPSLARRGMSETVRDLRSWASVSSRAGKHRRRSRGHTGGMPTTLHPMITSGLKPGASNFAGGTLACLCKTDRVTVEISSGIAHNHACGCTKCWKPAGAAFSIVAVVPSDKVKVTAHAEKLAVVDPSALIQRHACRACGAHLYGPVEKVHAFQGLSFIHPELFTESGAPPPTFAAFVSSVIEAGVDPAEMTDIRQRLVAAGLPTYDCLNPPLMDALATFAAKQKRSVA